MYRTGPLICQRCGLPSSLCTCGRAVLTLTPRTTPEENTMSKSRDDRWSRSDGLFDAAYGDFLIERGPRVVEAEDREWWRGQQGIAERIARDARKAQLIARKRAR